MSVLRIGIIAFLSLVASAAAQTLSAPASPLAPIEAVPLPPGVETAFAYDGIDLVGRTAELIATARKEILVSQYAITDVRVLQALSTAVQHGVVVAVLIDRSPAIKNYDTPRYLRGQNIAVIAATRGVEGQGWHNQRYVVIDREAVVITSCDLTNSARKNNENLIVLRMPSIAARYYNCWIAEAVNGDRLP